MGSALYVVHKWLRLINLELTIINVMPYNKFNDNPPPHIRMDRQVLTWGFFYYGENYGDT